MQEQLAAVHLCPEAHLVFIPDVKSLQGLYHENELKCSACEKVSAFTNFKPMPLYKIQEPNQRLYVANALTGIYCEPHQKILVLGLINVEKSINNFLILGVGYDNISLIMATLCLKIPNKTNFVPQILQT